MEDRIQIYRYTERKENWFNWVFSHLNLKENAKILELGSGNANLWRLNFSELPTELTITISDVSKGMLKAAKKSLEESKKRFNFKVINIESIPINDSSYDIIIANHMLYHANNRNHALREVKRVLKPDGIFYTSTTSVDHYKELTQIMLDFDNRLESFKMSNLENNFHCENGKEILERFFTSVNSFKYRNNLKLYEADPIFRYALSCFNGVECKILKQKEQEFLRYCNDIISQEGCIEITNKNGLFECFD